MNSSRDGGVFLEERGLTVNLAHREAAYFNYCWLRDNCASSFDPQTRERVFDIFALDGEPEPEAAAVVGDALEIVWRGDGRRSRYELAWLARYAEGRPRPDPADLPRRPWRADHYAAIPRFRHAALLADKRAVAAWIEALLVDGLAIVDDMPDSDEALTQLVLLMGQVRPTFFGVYFDVRTHIDPTNLAYTAKALELHTDTPAEDFAPGVQFLHCRANTVEGGESLFADGVAVAEDFRRAHPQDFALLAETDVPFFCEHESFDVRARQRVIELDAHGRVSGLTMSQHLADAFDLPQRSMDRYYPAFRRFGRMLQSETYLMRFRMNAGECFVFDNHRVVHGRAAYSAASGDRRLRGCYADRGEMRSTYRALVKQGWTR